MKKNSVIKIVVAIAVVLVMVIPIILDSTVILKTITSSDTDKIVSGTQNYGFSLIYIGKEDKDKLNDIKSIVKASANDTNNATAYFMKEEDVPSVDLLSLVGVSKVDEAYVFVSNGEIIKTVNTALSNDELTAYVHEYAVVSDENGIVPIAEELVNYRTLANAKEYEKLVKDKKLVTMTVFGRDTCFYCNQFKPVYNTVADENDLDIYYVDSDSYDPQEYQNIMDMGLTIPASCNDGVETDLSSGFGTPLTLFTKNGKVIDCISGYTNKQNLITKLKLVGMMK